jgi:uncharacterized protein YjbI with pentapeptide repeats
VGDAVIEQLVNTTGNARELLGLSGQRPVDLSSIDWASQFVVVRGVRFDDVTIAKTKFAANFVECNFDECSFEQIVSDGHFSGAGNEWTGCRFKKMKLSDLIAPQSRFTKCEFDEVEIDGFRLCQTVFSDCSFRKVSIRGLVTRKVGDRTLQLPETVAKGATALFRNCRFDLSDFTGCKFNDVCFEGCTVAETQFKSCSFEDVISRDAWLREFESSDPFIAFLDAAISGIRTKLGSDCESVKALEVYKSSYASKQTNSKDYSAVLYSGKVSDRELDVVEKILDKVSTSFPF